MAKSSKLQIVKLKPMELLLIKQAIEDVTVKGKDAHIVAGTITKITNAIDRVDLQINNGLPPGTYEDNNGQVMAKVD